jgi:uncharacterized membrane protein
VSSLTKRLSWALAVSLALNLFLLGFGSARWLRREAHGADRHGSAHERRELPKLFGEPTPELRAQHRALRDARRQVGEAIEAEPYQAARTESALAELRETTRRGQELLHAKLLERVAKLSPEERQTLARKRFLRGPDAREPDPL